MVKFNDINHSYVSVIPDKKDWVSVTSIISKYKEKFNNALVSERVSTDVNSKWYGLTPKEIIEIWESENKRSVELGKFYHTKMELGETTGIQCCPVIDEWKYASDQKLVEGVHPEFLLYHPEYRVCGQADRLQVADSLLNCRDYKSNKVITTEGFRGKKMLYPLQHLDDCHFNTYALQLSLYTYIGLYHNRQLQPGKLEIYHVQFENEGYDTWGYPITKVDKTGDYVVKEVVVVPVPYMKKEVELILEDYKQKTQS